MFIISCTAISQNNSNLSLKDVKKAYEKYSVSNAKETIKQHEAAKDNIHSGVLQLTSKMSSFKPPKAKKGSKNRDTLFVFDTMTVTGTWMYDGPVFVLNSGWLRFRNAQATILGDIVVWGDHARLEADSSYLYIPQQYFYERSLIVADKGKVQYRHTTLDHSGLSHNLVITDSAMVEMEDVTNIGFTTCGLYSKSNIRINGTNQAGEFILTENAILDFTNANTVLLWHQVTSGGVFNKTFPNGNSGVNYQINSSSPGVTGIQYNVNLTNCSDVMWGLMPLNNSDITISNSAVRSIGLWFMGSDTIAVNGLVDNTNYTDFTANLPDRHLRLVNSSVMTWSLYSMQSSTINVSGCILGEIGSMGRSVVNTQNIMVDGSGGYFWAGDTSFIIAWGNSATCSIRSDKNGIFVFAYSVMTNGAALALGNSILICIQSTLPDDPIPYWGGVAWMENINRAAPAFTDTLVTVTGSAWIDRGPLSYLMDFAWYELYYQKSGETQWTLVKERTAREVRNDTLAVWNTYGLPAGAYTLKLLVCDNSPDSNTFDAQKSVNLIQDYTAHIHPTFSGSDQFTISPNPAKEKIELGLILAEEKSITVSIIDIYGNEARTVNYSGSKCGHDKLTISVDGLPAGIYICRLKCSLQLYSLRFIKE